MYRVKKDILAGVFCIACSIVGTLFLVMNFGISQMDDELLIFAAKTVYLVFGVCGLPAAYCVCFRDFSFDQTGVYVKYPFFKERFYDWDSFQDVTVSFSYSTSKTSLKILFVKNGVRKSPLTGNWPFYGPLLFKIYSIPGDKECLIALKKAYPYELPSYGVDFK